MASELASLRERIGRSSRSSSKPSASSGPEFKPPERRKVSIRKRGGQHKAIHAMGMSCCRSSGWTKWWSTTRIPIGAAASCCGVKIQSFAAPGDRIPADHYDCDLEAIASFVVPLLRHQHLRNVAAGCGGQTLWAQVQCAGGLLMGSFLLSFNKVQLLLDQLVGVENSRGTLSDMCQRLSAALEEVTSEAHQAAHGQSVPF